MSRAPEPTEVPPAVPPIVPPGTSDTPWSGAFRRVEPTPTPAVPQREVGAQAEPKPRPEPQPEPQVTPASEAPVGAPAEAPAPAPPRPQRVIEPTPGPPWPLLAAGLLVGLGGTAALAVAALGLGPDWIDSAGSVAAATALAWFLARRTSGRAVIAAGLALGLGLAAVLVGGKVLPTGAAVMTCAFGGVYAVMGTVPAVTFLRAARELLVATFIAGVSAMAAVGFEPTVAIERFEIASLVVATTLSFAIVYRLGAGFHGLGRRGLFVVALGLAVLVATLAYAELLHRYGSQGVVTSVLDFVDWTSARIGAFPRPLVALLGIPAIVWGCFMRARRRQGWWVCAFGVAATVPMATALLAPDSSFLEAALRALYSLAVGLPLSYLVIRVDVALTGPRGRRGRRAEEAEAHRPEPSRFAEL